ncbi:MAG: hypothetical protein BGO78_02740 [Chloroflexi bacterium 44-23]|nr:MAG: hypothetical protein BGO78_02740 [Chloroflexi bacterium 44-23]
MISLTKSFRRLFNPSMHHPPRRKRPYFEGWYYKIANQSQERIFAIIPGVFYGEKPENDHAFVQLLDGKSARVTMQNFSIEQFKPSNQTFDIHIGQNQFKADHLSLDIPNGERKIQGILQFENIKPWPVTLGSPGIMGWYAYVPFMQCNHGVVSLDHSIQGSLAINGEEIDFSGGRGYIEKDWGGSFPDAWIWSQSNHFKTPGTSLTASIAIIPWVATAFPGFIIGLLYEGKLHRFTTYNGSKVETLIPSEKQIEWVVRNKTHRLAMHIERSQGFNVYAPTRTDMSGRVPETIDASIQLQLFEIRNRTEHLVLEDCGQNAGLEVAGDIERLITLWKK